MDYETFYEAFSTGTSLVSNVISLAISILTIIALWKIYAKANEPGWAALIPYYNQYVLYKISGKKKLFWAYLGISIAVIILYIVLIVALFGFIGIGLTPHYNNDEFAGYAVAFVLCLIGIFACAIAALILKIFQCIGLVKNFGLSGGYAVGLIFIPIVFYCIIAFSNKIQYVGEGGFYGGPNGYGPNGYGPNGQVPYGQPPVYMNPYSGQPQQGYPQNPYQGQPQNFGQNPYGNQPQNFGQNPNVGQPQSYGQNPYEMQQQSMNQNSYTPQNNQDAWQNKEQ